MYQGREKGLQMSAYLDNDNQLNNDNKNFNKTVNEWESRLDREVRDKINRKG